MARMAPARLVFTDTTAPDYAIEQRLVDESGLGEDTLYLQTRDPVDVVCHAADAEVIVLSWAPFTRETLSRLPRLRTLVRYGIGVDMVDVEAATDLGILVCNTARYCLDEVSTHAIALLLLLNRGLYPQLAHVRTGGWKLPDLPAPRRLAGLCLGLVGFGNIGWRVAAKARGLGLEVVAHDPYLAGQTELDGVHLLSLDEVLRRADYVSLHCPLNAGTRHLIGAPQLALMRPEAYLINTARGGIVDQAALVDALRARRIAGAALDVTDPEPLPATDPLRDLDNVLLTPHVAHSSVEALDECRRTAAAHALTVLRGGVPEDLVNRSVLERLQRSARRVGTASVASVSA
ncbi:MAG: C-terminal binding protein [Chloroflexi bacterium]|nr:C-terminal binding protein [Chloroflexota bacterium]